jgi:hypothetical protein
MAWSRRRFGARTRTSPRGDSTPGVTQRAGPDGTGPVIGALEIRLLGEERRGLLLQPGRNVAVDERRRQVADLVAERLDL